MIAAVQRRRSPPLEIEVPPTWNMSRHQRLEQATVCRNAEMQQLVCNHEILKARFLFDQVLGESDDASC